MEQMRVKRWFRKLCDDKAHKLHKKAHRCERNRISQGKHWERLRKEKDVVRLKDPSLLYSMILVTYS